MLLQTLAWALLYVTGTLFAWLTIIYVRFCWTHRKIRNAASALPTILPKLPVIGMLHHFSFNVEKSSKIFIIVTTQPKDHRATIMWLGPRPYFLLHRSQDFKTFLTSSKNIEKSDDYELMKFAFGDGLLVAPGDIWKVTRRFHNPIFHARNMVHLVTSLNAAAQRLIMNLEPRVGREAMNVHHALSLLSMQNILGLLFGPEFKMPLDEQEAILKSVEAVPLSFGQRFVQPWLKIDLIFKLLFKDVIEDMESNVKLIISRIMDEYKRESGKDTHDDLDPLKVNDIRAVTWLESIVRMKKVMPKLVDLAYMKGEIINLLGTGTDTVAVVMSSCLLALGNFPDIQDKVYKELIEVVGEDSKEITIDDTNKLTYLDQVLKETMRFFTIVPFVPRKADRDIQMEDFVIPSGSTVVMCLQSLTRDPKTFHSPDQFDPDHFGPEQVASREKYSFLPFAGGARDCIGKHYAMLQMKITISHILKNYRVISDVDINNMEFKYALLLISVDGYKVQFEKRHS